MKIESVKFVPPGTEMSNEQVVDEMRKHSEPVFDGDLDRTLKSVTYMLERIGADKRRWMLDERPIDLVVRAAKAAMEDAGIEASDVDLLLFAGIGRGFLEPGDSYFVSSALGMDDVECFDIMDACMSWTRACQVSQSFFATGNYRRALVVNCENYFSPGGISYPSNFTLKSSKDLPYCFSALCGGDGATATLLTADGGEPWTFFYGSTKEGVDLCTIPLPGYEDRCRPTDKIGLNGLGAFTAFSSLVFNCAGPHMVDILSKLQPYYGELKAIFAHTGGAVDEYEKWAQAAGASGLVKYLFPEYGNLGAAAIPASIATYLERGQIDRGDRIGSWIGSSGMSFVSTTFVL